MSPETIETQTRSVDSTSESERHPLGTVVSETSVGTVPRVGMMDRWLARTLLHAAGDPPLAIELWNGERIHSRQPQAIATFRVLDRWTLLKIVFDPDLQFGDCYSSGRIEIDGDLTELLEAAMASQMRLSQNRPPRSRLLQLLYRPRRCSIATARQNIHHHYDVGNDFYRMWLDEQLLYTCAYFERQEMSLEEAQVAKMDHVCRKLCLRPGDTVVEAGCGWGALALHMARRYGATVRAFNISTEQIAYARERAKAEGLADRVEFIQDDWRNITGRYDAFASVGMLEHVGIDNFRQLGDVIRSCLKKGGLGFIHTIGRNVATPLNRWTERRIFPGACPPSLKQMMDIFETAGCSVLDVENLRLHYALTLEHWLDRFEDHRDGVSEMFDARFVRTWRFYLAASIAAFRVGSLQLFQTVFAHADNHQVPWTRSHVYFD